MELTNTNIRYLLTIYDLSQVRLEVSSKDIAASLAVSRASVTSMMSILIDKNLVDKERYGKIHLTRLGRALARELAGQAGRLATDLQTRMDLSGEEAWKAACAAVSELPRRCFQQPLAAVPLPAWVTLSLSIPLTPPRPPDIPAGGDFLCKKAEAAGLKCLRRV